MVYSPKKRQTMGPRGKWFTSRVKNKIVKLK